MNILFINAQDTTGGASLAAYRLAKFMEKYHDCTTHFIVAKKFSADSNVFRTRKNEIETFIELMTDKVMNKLGLQYIFLPFSPRFILKKARELKPDIISLHNTHEGYFTTSLLKKLSRIAPIAWSLHDMWSFTANGCHTFGDESWKEMRGGPGEKKIYPHIGIDTGKWLLKRKKKIYAKSRIHLVPPSRWLLESASLSPVFEGKSFTRIPHGIDLELFSPKGKRKCREVLDMDVDAPTIIFTSAGDLDDCPWKGGKLLIDILKEIDAQAQSPINVMVIGKGELKSLTGLANLNIHKTGYVTSEKVMPILLSAADLFIYPTRADSFGIALVESIACGTPAVSFDIGGCKDIIKNDVSGYMIEPFDVAAFAKQTLALLNHKARLDALSKSARKFAEEHFDLKETARAHHHLFQTLINKDQPSLPEA